jgi:hypothetical protein
MEKIQITQEHIDTGRVGDAFNCAIAVGLKQEFAYEISVTGVIQIGKDDYQATREVVRWFGDFDKGRKVKPITIELVSYPFGKTYRPKGRQPIHVCGMARVAHSDRFRHNPQGKYRSRSTASTPAKRGTLSAMQPPKHLSENFIKK